MLETTKRLVKRAVIAKLRRDDRIRRKRAADGLGELPLSLWGYDATATGSLRVQGVEIQDLATRFGTPLHVVNVPHLRRTYNRFADAFRAQYPNCHLATSYKTNPLPAVLRVLHGLGADAEVISDFELWLAQQLGLPGDRVIVNGPGKTREMVARAVQMGARLINMDGLGEIDLIAAEASRAMKRQRVGVRVVTSVGWSSQFGLQIASGKAFAAFELAQRSPWLEPVGVHLHIGTGLKSVSSYIQSVREVLEFGRVLRKRLGISLQTYDLGGGFGVPTVRALDEWDARMVALGYAAREAIPMDCPTAEAYAAPIAELFASLNLSNQTPEVYLEPGRAITSSAQALLLRVIALKEAGGSRKLILDGGKNITMPLGWETHKIVPAQGLHDSFCVDTDLYGPLCHPGDIVARNLRLPPMKVGDFVMIMDAGAYFIPNQMNFSNPRPAVVMVENGEVVIGRSRETFEDITRLDGNV